MAQLPDRNLPVPLHAQIKQNLFERIQSGEWQPGMSIPTETELCRLFKVSRITVRRALSDLVTEGFLQRTSGRGTFVSQPPISQTLKQLTSFSQDMQRRGKNAGATVIEFRIIPADADLAAKLDLSVADEVILIKRLRLADDEPMAFESAHLPARYFPGLAKEDIEGRSLYQLLRDKFNSIPTRAVQAISAMGCPPAEAELLNIPRKSPILHIFRTTYDQSERLIEWVESLYRGDKYVFQAELIVEA